MKFVILKILFLLNAFSNYRSKNLPLVIEKNWTKFYLGEFENHVECVQWDSYQPTQIIKKIFLNLITYKMKEIDQINESIETKFDFIKPEQSLQLNDEQYFDQIDFTKIKEKPQSFTINFDIDFEVDQNLQYALYIKSIKIQDEGESLDALIIYIAAYQPFFDLSLREFNWRKDRWVLQFYRGFKNQNLDYVIKVKRQSCKLPLDYNNNKTFVIRDTLKKEVPYASQKKSIYFYYEILKDLPEYFQNKLYIPNVFYFTGSNSENHMSCELNFGKLKDLDKLEELEEQQEFVDQNADRYGLEIIAKVVSATLRYSIERDYFKESLNKDNKPCYDFKAQYQEESQRNISFLDSYPLGCLDHDIKIQIQDLYYENFQDIGSTWYQFGGNQFESKVKDVIIHRGTKGFYFKNKNIFLPHFATSGRFFPLMVHHENQYKFYIYFSKQNLFSIHQSEEQTYLEDVVPLNKQSLRNFVAQDDKKIICQRSFYEKGEVDTQQKFTLDDSQNVNILIIDEFTETSNLKSKLLDFHYVMTYSKKFFNQNFYGPFAYSNDTSFMCWQKIDQDSVDYIIIPSTINIPFKYPLLFLKKLNDDIVFQLYKDYVSLDLQCSIPQSETQVTDDYNIFNFNISVNYINSEQEYLSWIFQYQQREEWNMNDLKESLVFVLRQANINLIPKVTQCEIQSKGEEILINIYKYGIPANEDQIERKLKGPLQLNGNNQKQKEVLQKNNFQKMEKKII